MYILYICTQSAHSTTTACLAAGPAGRAPARLGAGRGPAASGPLGGVKPNLKPFGVSGFKGEV